MGQERDCFLELKRSRLYLTLLNFVFGGVGGVGGGTGLRQSRTEFLVVSSSPSVVVNLVGLGEGRGGRGAEGRSRTVAAAGSIISSVYLRPPHMSITPAPATPPRRIAIFPGWSLRLASKSPRGGQSERALRPLMNILEPSGGDGTARKERRLRGTTKKKEIRVPQTSSNCQRTRRKKHRLVYISSSARASSGALRFGIAVHFAPDVEDLLAFPRETGPRRFRRRRLLRIALAHGSRMKGWHAFFDGDTCFDKNSGRCGFLLRKAGCRHDSGKRN
jgi:hypothetical protein